MWLGITVIPKTASANTGICMMRETKKKKLYHRDTLSTKNEYLQIDEQ